MPVDRSKMKKTRLPGIWQDGPSRFLVVVQWTDLKTGRRKKREQVVSTFAEAVALREQLKGTAPERAPSRMRFADYAEQWLRTHAPRIAPSTQARYTEALAHAIVSLGQVYVDALEPQDVRLWVTGLAERYAHTTVNAQLRVLKRALDDAVTDGLLASNPAARVKPLPMGRTGGRRGRTLNAPEFRRFTATVETMKGNGLAEDIARLILTAAWTGMRKGELLELRWSDYSDGELHVERSAWRGHVKANKTDDPRRVVVVEPLAEVLTEQRQWLVRTQHPALESGLMFPASKHHAQGGATRRSSEDLCWHRSPTIFDKPLRKICHEARLPEISAHALRRTFENLLRTAGVDGLVRRTMAGWRSQRTQSIYALVDPAERKAAGAAVVALVRGETAVGKNKDEAEKGGTSGGTH